MRKISKRDIVVTKEIIDKFSKSNVPAHAGQIAFYMMLSFFPFLLLLFSLLNLTPLTAEDFQEWMFTIIPASFEDVIRVFTEEIYSSSSGRISISVITAVWLSSKAFVALQQGLNDMYQVDENRNFILLRVYGVLYSIIFAVLLIVTLGFMVFGNRIHDIFFSNFEMLEKIVHFRLLICIPVLILFFWLIYSFLPNKKQRFRNQIPGAVFASVVWIIFSYGFSIYVDKYNNYASFYGTMTTIALIMVWLYGCMYMLLLGGFVNYVLEDNSYKSIFKRSM